MHILYTYTRYITPKTWFILVSCLCWEHQHTHTRNYIQYTLVCIITYLPIDYTDLYSTYAIHLLIEKSMTSWRPTTSTGTLMDTSSGRCCCCSMLPSRWKVCCQDWLLAGWNLVENQADLFCYKGCTVWRNLELRKCGRKHNKTMNSWIQTWHMLISHTEMGGCYHQQIAWAGLGNLGSQTSTQAPGTCTHSGVVADQISACHGVEPDALYGRFGKKNFFSCQKSLMGNPLDASRCIKMGKPSICHSFGEFSTAIVDDKGIAAEGKLRNTSASPILWLGFGQLIMVLLMNMAFCYKRGSQTWSYPQIIHIPL